MARFLLRLSVPLVALALAAPAVSARAGGAAPVVRPDEVTTFPGNMEFPRVLGNDSDPEGDHLRVCGLGGEKYPRIRTDFEKQYVVLDVRAKASPGTYTFTYLACDGTGQTAGSITLVVAKPPRITVRAVTAAHGRVRASSRAAYPVRLTFGDFTRDDPEGVVTIPARGTVVFSTRYHRTDWIARTVDDTFLARGVVRFVP